VKTNKKKAETCALCPSGDIDNDMESSGVQPACYPLCVGYATLII